jgi:cytochrome c-type biogenesis protein CcmE
MKRKQIKFVVGSVAIIVALAFLGFSGFRESASYYQTVSELYASKDTAFSKRLRVEGDVVPGSIQHDGKTVSFVINDSKQKDQTLRVSYVGTDPLPDTFRDYAQAVVTGKYEHDGTFVAKNIEAKCASKYEKESAAGVTPTKTGY